MATKLTEHFTAEEFKWNGSSRQFDNFLMLAHFGLEPVRKKFGLVKITSGYRTPEYNASVGGSPTSQHVLAEACDFLVHAADKMEVYGFLCNEIDWPGQIFVYKKKGHLHIGLPRFKLAPTRKIMEANL